MTEDNEDLRKLLCDFLPGLCIESVASPSGQRVVYYAKFIAPAPPSRIGWGAIVVKIAEQLNAHQIAYLQKEILLLNSLRSRYYPRLYYNNLISCRPRTEDPLPFKIFVSIEERADAVPLTSCSEIFSTEQKVSKLLLDLIEGLNLLWSRPEKIVHRDLKPANLLVRQDESIVIIDLGIVREEGKPGITYDDLPCGPCTPLYASPEQARNDKKNISFKSDLFALGTIAYELMTGSNPYGKASDDARVVLSKVRDYKPKALFKLGLASEGFSNIIEVLMKKEPFERYRTIPLFKQSLLDFRKASYGS